MKTTLPATKARQQFFRLVEAAEKPGRIITITIEGEPKVVMMSLEDFETWQETLEVLSDKKLMKGIRAGIGAMKKNKLYTEQEVRKRLKLV